MGWLNPIINTKNSVEGFFMLLKAVNLDVNKQLRS